MAIFTFNHFTMLEFNFHPFPTLSTERLILRETTTADLNDLYKLRTNDKGLQYLDRPKETYEEVEKKLKDILENTKKGDNILWTICFHNDPKMIGTAGFWNFDKKNHRVEIGYSLMPEYWNKGIMTEAVLPILHYAFDTMKVHSIAGNINPENAASRRILEKTGFRKEAHFTEDYYVNGKFKDSMVFSLLEKWLVK